MKILIIGGTGDFGAFYAKLFKEEGFEVGISSRNEEKGKEFCDKNGYTFSTSPKGFDIIIVCSPNEVAPTVVKSIAPQLDKGTLLLDFCSVKTFVCGELEKLKDKDLELASIHPMHGPRVKNLKEIPIVLIPIKVGEKFELLKSFFQKHSACVFVSNKEEHDTTLSVVQGLTHYTQFVASNVLKELDIDLEKTLKFASPNYSLFISLATRVMVQNPQLYSQIQLENPNNEKIRKLFSKKALELEKICEKGEEKLEKNISQTKAIFKNPETLLSKSDKMTAAK